MQTILRFRSAKVTFYSYYIDFYIQYALHNFSIVKNLDQSKLK